jgi:hypothetical protein
MRGLLEPPERGHQGLGSEHLVGRRTFVGLVAAGWAAVAAGAEGLLRPGRAAAATGRAAAGRPDGVVVLGRTYLRQHPKESDADFLVRHLPGVDPAEPVRPQLPQLASTVAQDFGAGRVVSVDGWELAQTEARGAGAVASGR